MTESEAKFQSKCMTLIRKYGVYVYKNVQSELTEKGRPDLTCCIPIEIDKLKQIFPNKTKIGVFVGIELKRQDHLKEVSLAQSVVGDKIKNANGLWFAIDDIDILENLMELLTK